MKSICRMSRLARLKSSIEKLESQLTQTWSRTSERALESWDDYLRSRKLMEWRAEDPELRSSLITELLSYPLTLASYLGNASNQSAKPKSVVHVVGARAEATLPVLYWAQILRELNQDSLTLHFIGPDIPAKLDQTTDSIQVGNRTLKRSFAQGTYSADSLGGVNQPQPDLFVMFNPGLAHEKFKNGWRPVVKSMLDAKKPVLITGLHIWDATSDYEAVKRIDGNVNVVAPKVNPFASSKEFADGLSKRIARANMYTWNVQV